MAATVPCPHCGADNAGGAKFCEACGMALPSAVTTGPTVVGTKGFATTVAGQRLQSDELQKQQRKASWALLAVAIIQTIVAGITAAAVTQVARAAPPLQNPAVLVLAAVAVVFWGLFVWARFQPLPAAIVGLVLYATLLVINVIVSVGQMSKGGGGGPGIGLLNIVILAVLARAITAGIKYRKMVQGGIA